MSHLQVQRTVAEGVAPVYAFGAAGTEGLINSVFVIGFLYIGALERSHGAPLIFCTFVDGCGLGLKKTETDPAITADVIGVHAFDGRLFQYAGRGALPAVRAFGRIHLPDVSITATAEQPQTNETPYGCKRTIPQDATQEFTSGFLVVIHRFHNPLF
jgi:hypothetical protein